MHGLCRRGFTLLELLVVVGIIALLMGMLVPALSAARASARLTGCAANLGSIGKALQVYAVGNKMFPADIPPPKASAVGSWYSLLGPGFVPTSIDPYYKIYTKPNVKGDPLVAYWLLVLQQTAVPKQFVCASDPRNPPVARFQATNPTLGPGVYLNFGALDDSGNSYAITYSYSIQYLWNTNLDIAPNSWFGNLDAESPIGADIGPSKSLPLDDPTGPPGTPLSNSKNHGGRGQNVLFADGHVIFSTTNAVGPGNDNIYTGDSDHIYSMPAAWSGTAVAQQQFNTTTNLNASSGDVVLVPAVP